MNRHMTFKRPVQLSLAGLVRADRLPEIERVAARYAISITPAISELIDASDPHDPIARQFVPEIGRASCRERV